jgi:hypothetical protein
MKNYEIIITEIEKLALSYRSKWDINLCDSLDIQEYGLNEYFGGKAEGLEECLEILKKYKE